MQVETEETCRTVVREAWASVYKELEAVKTEEYISRIESNLDEVYI